VKAKESVNRSDKINSKTHTIMDSNNVKFPDDPTVTLTIRLIMQGKVSCSITSYHTDSAISFSIVNIVLFVLMITVRNSAAMNALHSAKNSNNIHRLDCCFWWFIHYANSCYKSFIFFWSLIRMKIECQSHYFHFFIHNIFNWAIDLLHFVGYRDVFREGFWRSKPNPPPQISPIIQKILKPLPRIFFGYVPDWLWVGNLQIFCMEIFL